VSRFRITGRGWQSQVLFGLSLLFLIFGLVTICWAIWPQRQDATQLAIPAGILPGAPAGTAYASLATYDLTISWPRWIRLGETDSIKVLLVPADDGESTLEGEDPTQVVLIEPTLGMMAVTPAGRLQANLAPGQALDMTWRVTGEQVGAYNGKVYLSFGFYDEAEEKLVPVPVAVVDVTIRVIALWGLQQPIALWLGFVGLVIWGVLFLLGRWIQLKHA